MPTFRIDDHHLTELPRTSLVEQGLGERSDLQRLLKQNISCALPDTLIIAEEFGEWESAKRRIDLLGIDRNANLVVIELKRHSSEHMDLQAIRYAAMVSRLSYDHAVSVYADYLKASEVSTDAEEEILKFLQWDTPEPDNFGRDVRIALVAAEFSKELTTAVLWLNDRDLDIRCVRFQCYLNHDHVIVDIDQVVPLKEASEYIEGTRRRAAEARNASRNGGDPSAYWALNCGEGADPCRSWDDCLKYGFLSLGGGERWLNAANRLSVGDEIFAYLSGSGYVGFGTIVADAVPDKDFIPKGQSKPLPHLPLKGKYDPKRLENPNRWDLAFAVEWGHTFPRDHGVHKELSSPQTLINLKERPARTLLEAFGISAISQATPA